MNTAASGTVTGKAPTKAVGSSRMMILTGTVKNALNTQGLDSSH